MIKSSKALTDFVKVSELYRKGFAEKLRQSLCLNDDLKNQIFELDQNKKLTQISYEIVQTKLNMLYESMTAISNAKNLEDKFQVEAQKKDQLIATLQVEKAEITLDHQEVTLNRDTTRQDNKEMVDIKNKADKEKARFALKTKLDLQRNSDEIKRLNFDLNVSIDNCTKANVMVKQLTSETQKMKQRIVKLKSRKGKVDQGIKLCKKCS